MIPRAHITAWRSRVPWATDAQVEQDLILSRAVVEMFAEPDIGDQLVMRGGTALQKLVVSTPTRYSEDIDLVQRRSGAIGALLDAIRGPLDPWLGAPRRQRGPDGVTLVYRFDSEALPVQPLRLKIEINTREHFSILGLEERTLTVANPWFSGRAQIAVYHADELFGTKLRALYQRRKGRDLFDLWLGLERGLMDPAAAVRCFQRYVDHAGKPVSRAQFEANLAAKEEDPAFLEDVAPLLARGVDYDPVAALDTVKTKLITRLPGAPWRGSGQGPDVTS